MPFEFPNAPAAGTTHTEFGVDYVWDGSVWNLASGGDLTEYVLKAGDTMTGPLRVRSAPTNGEIALLPGDATNNGRVEWTNPDNTRKAYLGYRAPTLLELNLDSATQFNITSGDVVIVNGALGIGDVMHGWKWNSTFNGEVLTSYQGKFGFHRNTTTSGNGDLLAQIDNNGWVAGHSGHIGPTVNSNVSFLNSFTGTMDFRVNPAMVTMRILNVKTVNAQVGTTQHVKICDYPAGVPAPWGNLYVHVEGCSDTAFTFLGRHAMVSAQTTGVHLSMYAGATNEDFPANTYFSCTLTWAR